MKQSAHKQNGRGTAIATSVVENERERDSARLREYEKVVEGLEDLIAVVDRDYRYIIANRTLLKYRSRTLDDVIGHSVREVIGAEVFDTVVKRRLDDCFTGKTVTFDSKIDYPVIGERDMNISHYPIEGRMESSGSRLFYATALTQNAPKRISQLKKPTSKRCTKPRWD
jgi:PAS domain-containing protein